MHRRKNAAGIFFALIGLAWFLLQTLSYHRLTWQRPAGFTNVSPRLELVVISNSTGYVETGWPFPMLNGEVTRYLAGNARWLSLLRKTDYDSILWIGLAGNLLALVIITFSFHELGRRISLASLFGIVAFCGWFLTYHSTIFGNRVTVEASIILCSRELMPIVILSVCLMLPIGIQRWLARPSQESDDEEHHDAGSAHNA